MIDIRILSALSFLMRLFRDDLATSFHFTRRSDLFICTLLLMLLAQGCASTEPVEKVKVPSKPVPPHTARIMVINPIAMDGGFGCQVLDKGDVIVDGQVVPPKKLIAFNGMFVDVVNDLQIVNRKTGKNIPLDGALTEGVRSDPNLKYTRFFDNARILGPERLAPKRTRDSFGRIREGAVVQAVEVGYVEPGDSVYWERSPGVLDMEIVYDDNSPVVTTNRQVQLSETGYSERFEVPKIQVEEGKTYQFKIVRQKGIVIQVSNEGAGDKR